MKETLLTPLGRAETGRRRKLISPKDEFTRISSLACRK